MLSAVQLLRAGNVRQLTRNASLADEKQVLVHDGAAVSEIATFPITPVDTLGAGDVWHGAFALALAEGRAEREAVRRANAAAALKAAAHGGRRAIPDLPTLEAFLAQHPT